MLKKKNSIIKSVEMINLQTFSLFFQQKCEKYMEPDSNDT